MKKLFLLTALGSVGIFPAMAQSKMSSVGNGTSTNGQSVSKVQSGLSINNNNNPVTTEVSKDPSGKTTVGGSRWYSYGGYVDLIATIPSDSVSLPYLWNKGNAMSIYSDGSGGLIADTIALASYGISFDPVFNGTLSSGFNDPAGYPTNSIVVTRTNPYNIDSVKVFGIYGRNILKTTSVDTLRIAVVYGNGTTGTDMPGYQFSGPKTGFPFTSFGYDTVRFNGLKYDKVRNIVKGTSRVIKDLYLTSADTSLSLIREFAVPVGMTVPAGNVVGISATFISGETYVPYVDTVFFGSLRPTNPFNYGMIRPRMFAEPPTPGSLSSPAFPRYYPGFYNIGFVKNLPESASWDTLYVPSYAYTAPFANEIPDIDVKVSCASCNTIQELGINNSSIFTFVQAYPNPATSELNIPFTIAESAKVTLSISNILGQVVATQNMGTINGGQNTTATFNTSNLTSGIYIYTMEANGQRVSNRFSVAH